MSQVFRSLSMTFVVLTALSLSGCSTLTSAFDSVSETVTGVFKSDGDKK
ncbi:hypothetical protein MCEMIEM12_00062 [Burkholderiaceae bacterium]|jgi:uncharacterized protein YceK